jgi:hypothetical protein
VAPVDSQPAAERTPSPHPGPRDPPIHSVWVVLLGDTTLADVIGPPPAPGATPSYARELAARGTLLSRYGPVADSALANEIALVAGRAPNPATEAGCAAAPVTAGCAYPASVATLPDELAGAGLTWRAYVEPPAGTDSACRAGDATWRNPFVLFHSIADSPNCDTNVVALDRLADDLAQGQPAPSLSYIVPAAPMAAAESNAFLLDVIPKIRASRAYHEGGLIVITADRPQPPAAGATAEPAPQPAPVGALLLSRYVHAGSVITARYDHYGLLRALEDIFGVRRLGHAADRDARGFGPRVYGNWKRRSE